VATIDYSSTPYHNRISPIVNLRQYRNDERGENRLDKRAVHTDNQGQREIENSLDPADEYRFARLSPGRPTARSNMILLTFKSRNKFHLGVKTPDGIIDVGTAADSLKLPTDVNVPITMGSLLAGGQSARRALEHLVDRAVEGGNTAPWLLSESELTLGPSVPYPPKILCVGLNYRPHVDESGATIPETPILFSKFGNAVAAAGEPIPLPDSTVRYDYEAELAVVIGARARYVSEAEAPDYVLGYCNGNDLSARDLQFRTSQWLLGKTLDKFAPIGPYLVTADQVGDPQSLPIRCWVNGALRQNATTAEMIFPITHLVSYISQYLTLEPGDIILTGTPEGVVLGMSDPVWLRPGDEVTIEIGNLGRLTNMMVEES
jgi:2-keto-4-pentenoate hydratase/2-oxohepta-3-ene-1,7-dioic acid hydratase in catechol pathway